MKYVRGTRIWRDPRLLRPPDRWTLQGNIASLPQSRATARARRTPVAGRACVNELAAGRRRTRWRFTGGRSEPVVTRRLVAIMLAVWAPAISGQSSAPAPYRAPTILLVQPPVGTTVPRDKPVVVFRFSRGEQADPIDVRTFAVTVDGYDRTDLFQVTSDEAWGTLQNPLSGDSLIAAGPHSVAARVCSVRGACAEATNTVVAVDAAATNATPAVPPTLRAKSTRARAIELMLDALRKLIVP